MLLLQKTYSAMHLVRYAAFATSVTQARFMSVNNVSFTKRSFSNSGTHFEKQNKATKAKRNNGNQLEPSKLYPDEWGKLNNFDVIEHFDFINDDGATSSVQEKSQSKSNEPKDITVESKEVEEERIFTQTEDNKEEETDAAEKASDSDSESDTENDAKYSDYLKLKRELHVPNIQVGDCHINKLPRRSDFLRLEVEQTMLKKSGMILLYDTEGIFVLAKNGILPKKIFFSNPKILSVFAAGVHNIALYKITNEDLKYWSPAPYDIDMLALYQKKELTSTNFKEPHIPLTIACDGLRHMVSFGHMMHLISLCPPKLFLISEGCTNPWNFAVLRNSLFSALNLNHDFNLTLEEIMRRIDVNDKLYILQTEFRPNSRGRNDSQVLTIPSVDLYSSNFWVQENVTLIMAGCNFKNEEEFVRFLTFCRERNAVKIDVGVQKKVFPTILFSMVFLEMRRQWLAKSGKVSMNESNNGKIPKFRVRIVSTLFKS